MFPENAWSCTMKKEKEESASTLLSVDLIPTFYISILKLVCLVMHRDAILSLAEHSRLSQTLGTLQTALNNKEALSKKYQEGYGLRTMIVF